jgi:hypothetical protein
VRRAADEWLRSADYLDSIRDATPEELAEARKSYTNGQKAKAEAKARKEARQHKKAEPATAEA